MSLLLTGNTDAPPRAQEQAVAVAAQAWERVAAEQTASASMERTVWRSCGVRPEVGE